MDVDVWSRPGASLAATSVFRLAEQEPSLRPADRAVTGRTAAALGEERGSVPRRVVEDLIAELPADDVVRLVALAETLAGERWGSLVELVGEVAAQEPLLVGAVTVAVLEQQPPPRWLAAMREGTAALAPSGLNVLASLIRGSSVWSAKEIKAAHALAPRRLHPLERTKTVLSFAAAEVGNKHLRRVRLIAEPVGQLLPLEGAPRTTAHLSDALANIAADEDAAELSALLLLTSVLHLDGLVPVAPSLN